MITITVGYNNHKNNCKVLKHFEENWKLEKVQEFDDDGNELEVLKGIHPKLASIKVNKNTTNSNEFIKVFDNRDKVFELQGQKALQLNVLESFLLGYLKNKK